MLISSPTVRISTTMFTLTAADVEDGSVPHLPSACEPTTSVLRTSQGPSEDAWSCLRPIIRKLYIEEDRTLTDVMTTMAEIYGHKAT
jgi:hypothetical protein